VDVGKYYAILPQSPNKWKVEDYLKKNKAKPVPVGFCYNSGENTEWLSVEDIRSLIKKFIDPEFTV